LTLLVGWQEGHPACKKTEWWGAGMVIRLQRGADGDAENAGQENAGLENVGPNRRSGKGRTRKHGTKSQGWKRQDWKTREHHVYG